MRSTVIQNGIFRPANNTLGIGTNNVERLRIMPDGKIGINTDQPSHQLDVEGDARIRTVFQNDTLNKILAIDDNGCIFFRDAGTLGGSGTGTFTGYWDQDTGTLDIFNNNSAKVGIGTASPFEQLTVDGNLGFLSSNPPTGNHPYTGALYPSNYNRIVTPSDAWIEFGLFSENDLSITSDKGFFQEGWALTSRTQVGIGVGEPGLGGITGGIEIGKFQVEDSAGGAQVLISVGGTYILESREHNFNPFRGQNSQKYAVQIGSQNSVTNESIFNSVILGGVELVADKSGAAFAQELRFNSSRNDKQITDVDSEILFQFKRDASANSPWPNSNPDNNLLVVSNDDGGLQESYIELNRDFCDMGITVGNRSLGLWQGEYSPGSSIASISLWMHDVGIGGGDAITFADNVNSNVQPSTTMPPANFATFIGQQNGVFEQRVVNSVIVGGQNVVANSDNTLFCQHLVAQGNITYFGGLNQGSDVRFKKDIQPVQSTLDALGRMQAVSFAWNQEEFPHQGHYSGRQNGFIAQEVQKIFPELVKENPDGYLTVNYTGLIPLLLEGMKELKAKVERLEEKG